MSSKASKSQLVVWLVHVGEVSNCHVSQYWLVYISSFQIVKHGFIKSITLSSFKERPCSAKWNPVTLIRIFMAVVCQVYNAGRNLHLRLTVEPSRTLLGYFFFGLSLDTSKTCPEWFIYKYECSGTTRTNLHNHTDPKATSSQ